MSQASASPADEAFYDEAPCGFLTTSADGVISRANATLLAWLGLTSAELVGRHFAALLGPGARVVWLTHHVPRLEQVARLDTVALDLVRTDGSALPVLVTAVTSAGDDVRPEVRMTLVDASERQTHERALLRARQAAERAQWHLRALQRVTEACSYATEEGELFASVATAIALSLELGWVRVWRGTASSGMDVVASAGAAEPPAPAGPDERVRRVEETGIAVLPLGVGPTEACAALPWTTGDGTYAVVEACVQEPWRGTVEDLRVIESMGTVVGQALDRVRLHQRLQRLAMNDGLTGLPNRILFLETVDRTLAAAERTGGPVTLLFVDLDGFKAVNDEHGHLAGDRVLQVSADRLRTVVRSGDLVGRLGGDEFVVLCPEADEVEASAIVTRIRTALAQEIDLDGLRLAIGASVGASVARPPYAEDAAAALLAAGDAAMYAEKRMGRARTGN